MGVVKVNPPLALTNRLLPPLSCKVSPVPDRPKTVPPMVYVTGGGGGVLLPPPHAEKESGTITMTANVNMRDFIPSSIPFSGYWLLRSDISRF